MADISIDAHYDGYEVTVENHELDLIKVKSGDLEVVINWAQAQQLFSGLRPFFEL